MTRLRFRGRFVSESLLLLISFRKDSTLHPLLFIILALVLRRQRIAGTPRRAGCVCILIGHRPILPLDRVKKVRCRLDSRRHYVRIKSVVVKQALLPDTK